MRLFVAAELPAAMREAAAAAAPAGGGWRALTPASLHVTLAFLGERADAAPVVEALRGVRVEPVEARLGDVVLLPARRPRVYALRVVSAGLEALQAQVAGALGVAGVWEPETRPFLAHVTVARARGAGRGGPGAPAPVEASGVIDSIALLRSEQNARYSAVFRSTLPG